MKMFYINSKYLIIVNYYYLIDLHSVYRRGKLYEFGETLLDKGTGNKQWKEKGIGDFKLLKYVSFTN